MIAPKAYPEEKERIENLDSYSILDTLPEEDYDNLTQIAASICGTPISLITLLDTERQWFKSAHGLDEKETEIKYSFCAHAIHDPEDMLVVQDSRKDIRFHDNPFVTGPPNAVFYAGVPLMSDEGYPLGTICVMDHAPKLLSQSQANSLKALSKQVMNLLRLRKNEKKLKNTLSKLEEKNLELERFAFIAAHDLKSPINNISQISKLFLSEYGEKIDEDGNHMIQMVIDSSEKLKSLIKGLLEFSKSDAVLSEQKTSIKISKLVDDLRGMFSFEKNVSINLKSTLEEVNTNETALDQILINLLTNAIKYSNKEETKIEIGASETKSHYNFYVSDNGPGIPLRLQEKIFTIFKVGANKDKYGKQGNGIGLATVKKIVEKSGGEIGIKSEEGKGAKFTFSLKK